MGWDVANNPDLCLPFPSLTTLSNYSDPPEMGDDRHPVITMNAGEFLCITPSALLYSY